MTDIDDLEVGSRWRHWKGGTYVIVAKGRLECDPTEPMVCYQNEDTQEVWMRPFNNFLEEADTRGLYDRRMMRFTEIK